MHTSSRSHALRGNAEGTLRVLSLPLNRAADTLPPSLKRAIALNSVAVATQEEEIHKEKSYRAGANLYLVKPVRPDNLVLHIKLLLGDEPEDGSPGSEQKGTQA